MALTTTASGLQYEDTTVGDGAEATKGQNVSVHYTGWLYNNGEQGAKFDSSRDRNDPFEFSLAHYHEQLVAGSHRTTPEDALVVSMPDYPAPSLPTR